jgi:hypothetical protein
MNIKATADLKATRKDILRLRKLHRTTDSRKEAIEAEAQELRLMKELRSHCVHTTLVCTNSAYKGSGSYDYENSHPEGRLCLFCGTHETAYNEGDFKILTAEPIARFESGGTSSWNKDPLDYDFAKLVNWCDPSRYSNAYFYFGEAFHARAEEQRKKEEEARRCKHCGCIPPAPPRKSLAEMAKDSPLFKERPKTELIPI